MELFGFKAVLGTILNHFESFFTSESQKGNINE